MGSSSRAPRPGSRWVAETRPHPLPSPRRLRQSTLAVLHHGEPRMSADGSVTTWIHALTKGDDDVAQHLWERYFQRMVDLARNKLRAASSRASDEEDVA